MPTVQQTWILVKKKKSRKQESRNGLCNLWDTLHWTFHLVYQQFLLVVIHLLYGPLCKVLAFNKHWTVPLLLIISSPLMLALYPPNLALGNKILRLIQGSFISFEMALWHQASCQISWITQGWREERKAKHFIPLMWTLRCSWGCSPPPWWWSLQSPTARRLEVPSAGRPLFTVDILTWLLFGPLSALNLRICTSLAVLRISDSTIALLSNQLVAWATASRSPLPCHFFHLRHDFCDPHFCGNYPLLPLSPRFPPPTPCFCCCPRVSAEVCWTLTFLCSVLHTAMSCLSASRFSRWLFLFSCYYSMASSWGKLLPGGVDSSEAPSRCPS